MVLPTFMAESRKFGCIINSRSPCSMIRGTDIVKRHSMRDTQRNEDEPRADQASQYAPETKAEVGPAERLLRHVDAGVMDNHINFGGSTSLIGVGADKISTPERLSWA
jgi:hypothetical protein